LTVNGTFQK